MVNKELQKYIENNIMPLYDSEMVDEGHKRNHIENVINRSMKFAKDYNDSHDDKLDYNMVYTIAAYHDAGLSIGPREKHALNSAVMVIEDKELRKFFNDAQITTMSLAVLDHRASNTIEPRSIYGKIVSQADRGGTSLINTINRAYEYRRNNLECMNDRKLMISEIRNHIIKKYGDNGYSRNKVWFTDEHLLEFFNQVSELSKDYDKFDNLIEETINKKG